MGHGHVFASYDACPCRYGVTEEVHKKRAAHAEQYINFIRTQRTAAARKYLTQAEGGEDDVNIGMKPHM